MLLVVIALALCAALLRPREQASAAPSPQSLPPVQAQIAADKGVVYVLKGNTLSAYYLKGPGDSSAGKEKLQPLDSVTVK